MNYFLTFLYYSAWILSISGFGVLFLNILKNLKTKFELEEKLFITTIGFLGFIFIYLISLFLNFFIPVNFIISHLILISGIFLLFLHRKEIFYYFKKEDLPLIIFLYIFKSIY